MLSQGAYGAAELTQNMQVTCWSIDGHAQLRGQHPAFALPTPVAGGNAQIVVVLMLPVMHLYSESADL